MQKIIIELKILRGDLETIIARGVEQTAEYAGAFGAVEAHLVIFNRDPETSWEEKLWQREQRQGGKTLKVWGC